jgi:hypothetical protein
VARWPATRMCAGRGASAWLSQPDGVRNASAISLRCYPQNRGAIPKLDAYSDKMDYNCISGVGVPSVWSRLDAAAQNGHIFLSVA